MRHSCLLVLSTFCSMSGRIFSLFFFFFQAEDGIRDYKVTGVQTCALPISAIRAGKPQIMKPIVVVPTYNEIENLEKIVGLILEQPGGFHILIVDDNSPDGTGRLADDLSSRHPGEVHVLHRPGKEGLGRAYVAGFGQVLKQMPEYDAIIQMDADLSHDPSYLPEFLKMLEKFDCVL